MSTENDREWKYFTIGLIVTGKGEEKFLPRFFRSIKATGHCHFQVVRRIGQRDPIQSQNREQRMLGTGKKIPNRDATEIGLPARIFLSKPSTFLILVDDQEKDRADILHQVYDRYRLALDTILRPEDQKRASVHFFVNMLEAYYFADARAINAVLGTNLDDFDGDVETIPHPKNRLKTIKPGFDEIEHGRQIVDCLDLNDILSRRETCASLRTLVGWCITAIGEPRNDQYQLVKGRYLDLTKPQIERLEAEGFD